MNRIRGDVLGDRKQILDSPAFLLFQSISVRAALGPLMSSLKSTCDSISSKRFFDLNQMDGLQDLLMSSVLTWPNRHRTPAMAIPSRLLVVDITHPALSHREKLLAELNHRGRSGY